MKQHLIVITVFFDPQYFNPNDAKKGLGLKYQEDIWTRVEAWYDLGCIVCVNNLEVDAVRLSRNPPLAEPVDKLISLTFISLPLDEPDDIAMELA